LLSALPCDAAVLRSGTFEILGVEKQIDAVVFGVAAHGRRLDRFDLVSLLKDPAKPQPDFVFGRLGNPNCKMGLRAAPLKSLIVGRQRNALTLGRRNAQHAA